MRKPRVIVAVVALVVAGGFIIWRLGFRDTTTPVSPGQVVDDVSAPVTSTVSSSPPEGHAAAPGTIVDPVGGPGFVVGEGPGEPGLYVYRTSGHEEIDALGGARHDYPPETFLTIQPGGCGIIHRWTAIEERYDELELCETAGGLSVGAYDAYHRWFGQADLQEFSCGPADAVAIPFDGSGSWTYRCANDARTEIWTVEVTGTESLPVAGTDAPAVRVRVVSSLTGDSIGTSETETWYLEGTSLVLKRVVSRTSINESLVGDVTYTEQYEIELVSLLPRGEHG